MAALEKKKLRQNTLILFASDNGSKVIVLNSAIALVPTRMIK